MNKYINTFANSGDYETYKASSAFTTPNVAYIEDSKEVKWLNSKKDLYDIYGTVTDGTTRMKMRINGGGVYLTISDGKLMYNWTGGTITSLRECFLNSTLIKLEKFGLDTSNVSDMTSMFCNCHHLTSLDLSGFVTSAVTDMNGMFFSLPVTSLDVSCLNTSSVTSMKEMFYQMSNITNLDLSNFDTSIVTDMTRMFSACVRLGNLNLSNWDLTNVTTSTKMFIQIGHFVSSVVITMNNTNQTTFDMIKAQLVSDNVASHVTIIRDGVNWKYQNGAWVEA